MITSPVSCVTLTRVSFGLVWSGLLCPNGLTHIDGVTRGILPPPPFAFHSTSAAKLGPARSTVWYSAAPPLSSPTTYGPPSTSKLIVALHNTPTKDLQFLERIPPYHTDIPTYQSVVAMLMGCDRNDCGSGGDENQLWWRRYNRTKNREVEILGRSWLLRFIGRRG